jgi:hypothetical protein
MVGQTFQVIKSSEFGEPPTKKNCPGGELQPELLASAITANLIAPGITWLWPVPIPSPNLVVAALSAR